MKVLKKLILLSFLSVVISGNSGAYADVLVDWTINNAHFVDGATLTGTFTIDATTNTLVSFNITAGATPAGYLGFIFPQETYVSGSSTGLYDLLLFPRLELTDPLSINNRNLFLSFPGLLPATGGTVAIMDSPPGSHFDGNSFEFENPAVVSLCSISNCTRSIDVTSFSPTVTGVVEGAGPGPTPVPEPTTSSLLGIGILGVAAWRWIKHK
jgi:hypothetical protein